MDELDAVGSVLVRWERQHAKARDIGKEVSLARAALERIGAVLRDDPNEEVRLMQHLHGLYAEGGAGAVKGYLWGEVEAGLDEGFDWDAPGEPDWLVDGWLLRGRVQSLYGKGEIGKSRMAMQWAYALATGEAELLPGEVPVVSGVNPVPARVLAVSWEMTAAASTRLVRAAAAVYGHGDAVEAMGGRLVPCYVGGMGPLWRAGLTSGAPAHETQAMEWLRRRVDGFDLCILDSVAAAYAANEIDRGHVRGFLSAMDRLAIDSGCAVLLIGHSSRSYLVSGSTDWENMVRVLLAMEQEGVTAAERKKMGEAGEVPGTMLRVAKMNDARKPAVRWLGSHKGGGWVSVDRSQSRSEG